MTSGPWWLRHPARLEREESALRAAGIVFRRVDEAFARGIAQLRLTLPGPDGQVEVNATYPDAYPYFKPFVTGPDIGIQHHWNPSTGEYCLLETREWLPEKDTLATLVIEQWPTLKATELTEGVAENGELLEADQAEPFTRYMQFEPGSQLVLDIVPSLPEETTSGGAVVLLSAQEPLRGFVGNVHGVSGEPLMPAGVRFYAGRLPELPAAWVRLANPPRSPAADDVWASVVEAAPNVVEKLWSPWPTTANHGKATQYSEHVQLILVTFPEEVARRKLGMGWCAVWRRRPNMSKPPGPAKLLRVARAGVDELLQRTPNLRAMRDKTVVVVGGGGLGSALLLMIAGWCLRELVIVDGDAVDPATGVRFPSALRFGAGGKTSALSVLVCETQPYTNTERSMPIRLGVPRRDGQEGGDLHAALEERIVDADLVIDATADTAAQHYLSDLARQSGTAYLQAEGTPGVWGGLVALFPPGSDACWMCLQHALAADVPPLPASDEPGAQPPGCGEPTYTGTGFDLATIGTHAARVAAAYLTGETGYGAFDDDLFLLELRDTSGQPVPARWTGQQLTRHPSCKNPLAHPPAGAV